MDFRNTLGNNVKQLRKNLNLSQDEFCMKLNIEFSRVNLSRIEAGKQLPSAESIKSVVESFNVSPYWLLDIKSNAIGNRIDRYELLNEEDKETLYKYIDFLLEMSNKMNP